MNQQERTTCISECQLKMCDFLNTFRNLNFKLIIWIKKLKNVDYQFKILGVDS